LRLTCRRLILFRKCCQCIEKGAILPLDLRGQCLQPSLVTRFDEVGNPVFQLLRCRSVSIRGGRRGQLLRVDRARRTGKYGDNKRGQHGGEFQCNPHSPPRKAVNKKAADCSAAFL
ncbi:MAG: hypothetical protein ACTHLK_13370, partial [Brucella intermedia]